MHVGDSSIYLNWLLENIYNKVPNSNSGKNYELFIFLTFAVIFLPDFISNCVYTANLENHCIYIRVELQRNQSFRYFVTDIEFWV